MTCELSHTPISLEASKAVSPVPFSALTVRAPKVTPSAAGARLDDRAAAAAQLSPQGTQAC